MGRITSSGAFSAASSAAWWAGSNRCSSGAVCLEAQTLAAGIREQACVGVTGEFSRAADLQLWLGNTGTALRSRRRAGLWVAAAHLPAQALRTPCVHTRCQLHRRKVWFHAPCSDLGLRVSMHSATVHDTMMPQAPRVPQRIPRANQA